ncbi:MAG: DinB family protein [Candidatus Eiseniibacteriota bacterium]
MSTDRNILKPLPGFRSQEVASFLAQMDDQTRRLMEGLKGATPEELEWQPYPGTNTIGMLLAHNAIVEVFWTMVALKEDKKPSGEPILGIKDEDDGMPLPEDGKPPAALAGKDLATYDTLLKKARAYLKQTAASVTDADLEKEVSRIRPNGEVRVINLRWYFYHILEHYSGHFGQVLLLRHLYQAARVPTKA